MGTLDLEALQRSLTTRRVGRVLEYRPSTTSTNDEALGLLERNAEDGVVVLAEHQSAGRGRFRRSWHSPRGASVLLSVGLRDLTGQLASGGLGLITATACVDAIRSICEVRPLIRWPNDLVCHGRKLGGILVEARRSSAREATYVVGIGINCLQQAGHFPPDLASTATSLEIESAHPVNRTSLVTAVIAELDRWLAPPMAWDPPAVRDAWMARAEPMGQRVYVQHGGRVFSGTMLDLDPQAALIVQLDEGGIRAFNAADTTVVAPGGFLKNA